MKRTVVVAVLGVVAFAAGALVGAVTYLAAVEELAERSRGRTWVDTW